MTYVCSRVSPTYFALVSAIPNPGSIRLKWHSQITLCFLTVPGSIPTAKGVTTFEHRVELGSWEDRQRLCGESSRELSDYRTK